MEREKLEKLELNLSDDLKELLLYDDSLYLYRYQSMYNGELLILNMYQPMKDEPDKALYSKIFKLCLKNGIFIMKRCYFNIHQENSMPANGNDRYYQIISNNEFKLINLYDKNAMTKIIRKHKLESFL